MKPSILQLETKQGYVNELVVMNTEPTDSGYYQCVGENQLGLDSAVARLEIFSGSEYLCHSLCC